MGSAIPVVVGSRHTWLSGACTWAVIKRIVKVRIAFWLLEVLPDMWHFFIVLLLALSDNLPLTSSQPVFSSNLEAHGLELPMLSREQLSPAPAIKLGQLVSFYNDDGAEQKFNSGRLQPTPLSPLSEELILQKPPTGP